MNFQNSDDIHSQFVLTFQYFLQLMLVYRKTKLIKNCLLTTLSNTGGLSLTSSIIILMVQASSSCGWPLSDARTVIYASFSLDGSSWSKIYAISKLISLEISLLIIRFQIQILPTLFPF